MRNMIMEPVTRRERGENEGGGREGEPRKICIGKGRERNRRLVQTEREERKETEKEMQREQGVRSGKEKRKKRE